MSGLRTVTATTRHTVGTGRKVLKKTFDERTLATTVATGGTSGVAGTGATLDPLVMDHTIVAVAGTPNGPLVIGAN